MLRFSMVIVAATMLLFSIKANATDNVTVNYVSFPSQTAEGVINVSAKYLVPRGEEGDVYPAVIILHTTGGVDSTGSFYASALNRAGIATLEVDMWGARGLDGGADGRPALPQETIPDAFGALAYLAQQEEIDATKIGLFGLSWGGVITMLTATEQYSIPAESGLSFAAHVAHYPVCWVYNTVPGFEFENLTGAPVFIQTAELDDYDAPETCPDMIANLQEVDRQFVSHKQYRGAFHTFDRLQRPLTVEDPFSNLGQGGLVRLRPNFFAAIRARRAVVRFFDSAFE